MEKLDFRKYKYILATVFIIILFVMIVANAYSYLPSQNETNNLKNKQYIEAEEDYNNNTVSNENIDDSIESEDDIEENKDVVEKNQIENKFANFFDEEEKNLDFETTERFKELSDDELE